MAAIKWIVVWGLGCFLSAVVGGIIAHVRNRDPSAWAAWAFLFPPALLLLVLIGRNQGPRPRRPTLDEEDRHHERV
jgi:hypothetical protein